MALCANLVLLIAQPAKTKTHALVVLRDSLFLQSTLLQRLLTPCVRKSVVMERDLSMLVMTETPTTMMAVTINVKLTQAGAAQVEQQHQKVFV